MRQIVLFLLILASGLAACRPAKDTAAKGCTALATVIDESGLDGCGKMLRLEDGRKAGIVQFETEGFGFADLKAGQRLRIGYREVPDVMSTCMAENLFVALTCVESLD